MKKIKNIFEPVRKNGHSIYGTGSTLSSRCKYCILSDLANSGYIMQLLSEILSCTKAHFLTKIKNHFFDFLEL